MKRTFYLAKNVLASNFTDLKEPYRLTYIVTHRCQLRCTMCNIWQKPAENELTLAEIESFFERSNRFSWVNLSGGEIFLREDLLDIIKILYENCNRLYLLDFPTNGFQTDIVVDGIKRMNAFCKIPRLLVTVSLDGPPHLHDKIRNSPGSWIRAVETFEQLRKLRDSHFNVFFGMTLQPVNMDRFRETFRHVNRKIGKMRYNDFHINLVQHSTHYYDNRYFPEPDNRRELWAALIAITKLRKADTFNPIYYLEETYQRLAKIYLETKKSPVTCQALSGSCFLDPEGNVYPCSIYDRPVGNVRDFDYDITGLWKTAYRAQLRQEIRNGRCPQCWTPCEAYQSILANIFSVSKRMGK